MNTIIKKSYIKKYLFLAYRGWCGLLISLLLLIPGIVQAQNAVPYQATNISNRFDGVNLPFVNNVGQSDQRVGFYVQTLSGNTYVTNKGEIVYSLPSSDNKPAWTLVERFEHAGKTKPVGIDANVSRVSYIKSQNGKAVTQNASTFGAIKFGEVYPGVQIELRTHGRNVEKIYTVNPGSDATRIKMSITGAKSLKLDQNGNLIAATSNDPVSFSAPVAWQIKSGLRVPVKVAYELHKGHQYAFKIDKYDQSKELIIDPILQSTYLGGSSTEDATSMVIHPLSGEVYVVGYTYSSDFPGIAGGADITCGSSCSTTTEVFVARLSSDLKTLLNATYLGGSQNDEGRSIAIHPLTGDIYVTGNTHSTDFPGIAGGADTKYIYPWDLTEVFVSRISFDLTTLKQSTYLGGNAIDQGTAIAIHPQSGDVYVAGNTSSDNFPGITANSADASCAPTPLSCSGYSPQQEGFVARLSSDLKTIYQSTYLGGTGSDALNGLTIHPLSGDIYVAGQTRAWDFPYIAGGADVNCSNCTLSGQAYYFEGFVTRLSPSLLNDGNVQSTYLGGNSSDRVHTIAAHPINGDIYVGGATTSYDFPVIAGGADTDCKLPSCADRWEGFVSRLSSDLGTIKQSTYLGGMTDDNVVSLAINPESGDIYATGYTDSQDFPGIAGGADTSIDPGSNLRMEAFVSQLSSDLKTNAIKQSTYLGGSGYTEYGRFVVIHPDTGDIYVAGVTSSTDFPKVSGGADENCINCSDRYPANTDAFIARLDNLTNQQRYSLTVTKAGTGTVTSSPAGISCGSDCQESYLSGTVVTLTATPISGSTFTGWSGACSGSSTCTVTLSQDRVVTATFYTPTTYGLTVSKTGTGTGIISSTPTGINCGNVCSANFTSGIQVILTAQSDAQSIFSGWSACTGIGVCVVDMTSARSVTATFNLIQNNNPRGTASGLNGAKVVCSNLSTRQVIGATIINNSWDCVASGLTVSPGDRITMTIKGIAQ